MANEIQQPEIGRHVIGSITLRAAAVGLFCVLGITIAGCVSAYLRYDLIGTGHLPRCALYPILVILALNVLLKKALGKRGLSRTEMLFIYCTILVMTGIPGQQFATYLYLGLVGPIYYATPQNQYADPVSGFHQHISEWLVPSKDPNHPVVKWMFEGLPQGAGFYDIPWGMWVRPLLVWTPFCVLIFFVTLCVAALLRKQWVERERLLFPLAQVPLEITRAEADGAQPASSVFRSKLMWLGFSIPVIVYIFNGLNAYFPSVPKFDLYPPWMWNLFSDKPWNVLNSMGISIYFGMIGIAYLLTAEVGFSFWFFFLFDRIQEMVMVTLGKPNHWIFRRNQHVGSFLMLGAFYAWVSRRHIAQIVRKSFTRAPDVDDSDEPLSYRVAFFGATGGFLLICGWCWLFGLSLLYAAILFGWYFLSLVVLTRIVAEAGLFVFWFGIGPQDFTMQWPGYQNVSHRNITMLQLVGFNIQDSATSLMPQGLQAMKIAGEARLSQRKLFGMMMAAVVVAVLASHVPSLWVTYKTAVPNLGWWTRGAGYSVPSMIEGGFASQSQFKGGDAAEMGFGAAFTGFLLIMRQRFLWWPFHPLGYAANTTWTLFRYWFPILVGWSIKVLVTWLGGVRLWRKLYPAAIGLIVGEAFILFTWLLFHFLYPIKWVLIIE